MHRISRRGACWAAGVFLFLAVVHTWPLVTGLDHLSRHNDDEYLNAWAVSWVAHQLLSDPFRLFEANIFYPHEQALAYTEPLIVPGVMGVPILWLSGSPLLTYNLLLLLGLTLTALAMYGLVVSWSGDHWGGLLAGALLAFSTPMLTRLPHLQILHLYWLPLACFAFDRLLTRRRMRDAVLLGASVLGAGLTSGYLVIFVTFTLGAILLARTRDWWGRDRVGVLWQVAVSGVVTLLILLSIMRPYQEVQFQRPLSPEAASIGAALESYLSSATRVHHAGWSQPIFDRAPGIYFPGVVALTFAAICLLSRRRIAPVGTRRMLVVIALVGVTLSLGPLTPVYTWLYHAVPPLQGLRSPIRFGIVVLFALAALAGLGLSLLRQRVAPNWRVVGSVSLIVFATVESIHGPISYTPLEWNPPIYEALRTAEPGPVVEIPIYGAGFNRNARYLLASTTHWRPLVNGFGGFRPPRYNEMSQVINTFPSPLALARLQALKVRHVVVHTAALRNPDRYRRVLARMERLKLIVLLAEEGTDRLYRIADFPQTRVRALLFSLPWSDLTPVRIAGRSLGQPFGLQGPNQFLAYLERTRPASRISLRPPTRMTGVFLDVFTGEILSEVSVEVPLSTDSSTDVVVPPGRRAVLLSLRPSQD